MTSRDELYRELLAERFGPAPVRSVPPVRVCAQRARDVADLTGRRPVHDTPDPEEEVLRLARFRWSPHQIAAVLTQPEARVRAILTRRGLLTHHDESGAAA